MSKTMSDTEGQKGNVLLITLLIAAIVGAGGYFAYTKGSLKTSLDLPKLENGTAPAPEATSLEDGTTEVKSTQDSEMTLMITSPKNGLTLQSGSLKITGKTKANAEVFINDVTAKADANGNFSMTVNLDEGVNTLVVTANDEEGNVVEQTLSVNVQTF